MPKPKAVRKQKTPKPPKLVTPTKAPEVEALAKDLIERDHHSLRDAGIRYGFYGADQRRKTFGKAKKIPIEERVLLERPNVQATVMVSPGHWRKYSEERRKQALDELLCSVSFDGKELRIEKPDFKGFRANLMRYFPLVSDENEEAFRGAQLSFSGLGDFQAPAFVEDEDRAADAVNAAGAGLPEDNGRDNGDGELDGELDEFTEHAEPERERMAA